MLPLNLPLFDFKLRNEPGKTSIFDTFRKKYVTLTPEEWVRQHFLHWLVTHKGFPSGLIAVEASLKYNTLKKRADAIIYNKAGKPTMIVECKAPEVKITQNAFDQIAIYNYNFGLRYLAVTNGLKHFCCQWDASSGNWKFLEEFPDFYHIKDEEQHKGIDKAGSSKQQS